VKRAYRLVDLSHTIEDGMITYKGLPAPVISDHLTREASEKYYAPGTQFQIGRIEMVANTGTYLDSPFHRYQDGRDLAAIDLYSLANQPGVVVRTGGARSISIDALSGLDLQGKAVLFHTGWDVHWRTEKYFENTHPYLSAEAAAYLAQAGATVVGIDSYNIDDTEDARRPAHSILLRNDILIVEHLCRLADLPDRDFQFFAVPVKVKGMASFLVRAFGIVRGV
jgi:kynurenine formamidase